MNLDGVRGFVPASQVTEIRGGDEASKQADMARLIGTTLPLKVIEINRHRNRLILSERQAIQERRDVMKEQLIQELKEGEVRKGRVSSICDFGAFVDIGGADGLVHLSELSWSRVRHPSEVLRVGQEVDVYVLGINSQEKKIALSIKRTQAEPWSRVAAKYEVGQLVRGAVTQLANFGAFARIEDGIEGLIHVSELADERITHPKQVVSEGQPLLLRIIRIDPQRRRMGLSLRRALDTPDPELIAAFGEEGLAERDALQQALRAAIEAEGIEPAPPRDASADEAGAGEDGQPTENLGSAAIAGDPASSDQRDTEAPVTAAEANDIVQSVAGTPSQDVAELTQPRAPKADRRASRTRPAPELPVDLQDEELSAMAMAFAMAGAPDLVEEVVAGGEPTVADEDPAETVAEAAPAEAAVPVEAEAAAPAAAEVAEAAPIEAEVEAEASAAVEAEIAAPAEPEAPAEEPVAETVVEEAVVAEAPAEEAVAEVEATVAEEPVVVEAEAEEAAAVEAASEEPEASAEETAPVVESNADDEAVPANS